MKSVRINAALFGLLPLLLFTADSNPTEVPFEFVHNQVVISVSVNGRGPFAMLLDTGTDPSAIDLATAKELGLKLQSVGGEGTGVGSETVPILLTSLDTVEIAGMKTRNIQAGAIDLTRLSDHIGTKLHGVLGYSLLKDRVVQFDYPARVIRFLARAPEAGLSGKGDSPMQSVFQMAFARGSHVPVIAGVVVGGKPLRSVVDTGSSMTFSFTPAGTEFLGLTEIARKGEDEVGVGYRGRALSKKAKLDLPIRVGTITAESPMAYFSVPGTGRDKALDDYGLSIGNAFMQNFVVTFDYHNRVIVFLQR